MCAAPIVESERGGRLLDHEFVLLAFAAEQFGFLIGAQPCESLRQFGSPITLYVQNVGQGVPNTSQDANRLQPKARFGPHQRFFTASSPTLAQLWPRQEPFSGRRREFGREFGMR